MKLFDRYSGFNCGRREPESSPARSEHRRGNERIVRDFILANAVELYGIRRLSFYRKVLVIN